MNIYVASSWTSPAFNDVVKLLRGLGHKVYNFRESAPDEWASIEKSKSGWEPREFSRALMTVEACRVFSRDFTALQASHATVMVTPCGRSAHLELGIAHGLGQNTAVLLQPGFEPELMIKVAHVLTTMEDLKEWAGQL